MELMEFRLAEVQQSMEQRWQRYSVRDRVWLLCAS